MPESKAADVKKTLESTDEIKLTVTGRVTGRESTRPVWFVVKGRTLYLRPVTGSDGEWYKNVLANPTITLSAKGVKWTARAKPITDPEKVREVVEMFREKYGASEIKKYYTKTDVAAAVPLP